MDQGAAPDPGHLAGQGGEGAGTDTESSTEPSQDGSGSDDEEDLPTDKDQSDPAKAFRKAAEDGIRDWLGTVTSKDEMGTVVQALRSAGIHIPGIEGEEENPLLRSRQRTKALGTRTSRCSRSCGGGSGRASSATNWRASGYQAAVPGRPDEAAQRTCERTSRTTNGTSSRPQADGSEPTAEWSSSTRAYPSRQHGIGRRSCVGTQQCSPATMTDAVAHGDQGPGRRKRGATDPCRSK